MPYGKSGPIDRAMQLQQVAIAAELSKMATQLLNLTEAGLYKILGNEVPDGVKRDVEAYFEGLRKTATGNPST